MKVYLQAFINYEQINQVKLILIAKFAYNNAKNASNSHTPFELNYDYYSCIFYKKDNDSHFKSKVIDKLANKLKKLITLYRNNFYYAQEL